MEEFNPPKEGDLVLFNINKPFDQRIYLFTNKKGKHALIIYGCESDYLLNNNSSIQIVFADNIYPTPKKEVSIEELKKFYAKNKGYDVDSLIIKDLMK